MAQGQLENGVATPKKKAGRLEPIAIIGIGLRFPQEATSAASFWNLLLQQRCTMTEWPKERLNVDAFYHSDKNRNDTVSNRESRCLSPGVNGKVTFTDSPPRWTFPERRRWFI